MSLYANINKYLQTNGIKQNYLAQKTGMSKNAITLSLNGKRKLTADEYVSVCKALNVPLEEFVKDTSA